MTAVAERAHPHDGIKWHARARVDKYSPDQTAYAASLQDVDEGRVRMSWMQNSSGRR